MASSEVEISPSSPFGCVLRDRNHRDGCRETTAFQRNIKNFVMDHLNTCISTISSDSTTNENNDIDQAQMNNSAASSWVSKPADTNNLARLRFKKNNHINNEKEEASLASLISPRHSRLLDRWAAKQAREMVSTLENEEAELLAIDSSNNSSNNNSSILTRTSSSNSDELSSETLKLGASSLVQIWEKRLNKSSVSKPNTPIDRSTPNTATCIIENAFAVELQSRVSETECCPSGNEEPFSDWESDKTSVSSPSRGRWGSSESDRVSVADIIKRLQTHNEENDHEGCSGTSSVVDSPCRERDIGSTAESLEQQRVFPQVTCAPRIRGRRAFDDLLMKLEQDRNGELKNLAERGAVSKFTQKGRIQASLRLRLLQRGVAGNEPYCQKSTASEVIRQPAQGSAIMQLREKFSNGAEQRITVQVEVANPKSPHREIANTTTLLDNSPSVDQLSKDKSSKTSHETADQSTKYTQKIVSHTREDHDRQEAHPSSDLTLQETHFEARLHDSQETAEATTSKPASNPNEREDKAETSNQQYAMSKSSYDETVVEQEASNQNCAETSHDNAVEEEDYAESCYEESEAIYQNYSETNYDWISEISRPRSYWEERRQAWYKEMLDSDSQKEDIRKLLERKTVSTFLTSDFRETMDRLMQSHRGTQTHLVNSVEDDEEDNQGLMAFLQERMHSASTPQEDGRERGEERIEEEVEEEVEEEEEEKADEHEHEHEEAGIYSNPSLSWSYRDNEAGDDFDRVVSTSPQPYQSQSYGNSRRNSSASNHNSIEMELIYDMRGNMEQLYREMSELRKSIRSCMDMQMQLQQSMNHEVHTVKKEEKKFQNRAPKKGNCCICYETKIDSVLYRCGHMCTCLKCANELQCNSGKCPICRAKIVDVVRVYVEA